MPRTTPKLVSREDLPNRQVKLVVEIPAELAVAQRAAAVRAFASELDFKGFRPGQAPEALVVAKVGEKNIAEEAISIAVRESFPELLAAEKIAPLVPPKVTVEPGEDGGAKVTALVTLLPQVTLPDYRTLAKGVERREFAATEEEVTTEIDRARRAKRNQGREHKHDGSADCEGCAEDASPLPELTDEEALGLGAFESVADLREKATAAISQTKEMRERNRRRQAIVEAIVAAAKPEIPDVVVERELDRMVAELERSVSQVGLTLDGYLAQAEKKMEDVRKEWREEAARRAATHLILPMIAAEEKLVVNPELVARETDALLARAPGASREDVEAYVAHLVRSELVLSFLESLDEREAEKK